MHLKSHSLTVLITFLNCIFNNQMASFISKSKPNLMFIHLLSIDEAGHSYGWGSDLYYKAVMVMICTIDNKLCKIVIIS